MTTSAGLPIARRSLSCHGRARPGHPDAIGRRATQIGITGKGPVTTREGTVRPGGREPRRTGRQRPT
ncbi:hypothetical protein [Microvirga yunnanensis]|uniref:hypothetical protein n=1 Tax=Microvirga yunnanensis TaxID=2953740 RepID=UPI0021CAC837|nr:hypothetical protein [Microvirga sp. HBU65207]